MCHSIVRICSGVAPRTISVLVSGVVGPVLDSSQLGWDTSFVTHHFGRGKDVFKIHANPEC